MKLLKKILIHLYGTLTGETGKELWDQCAGFCREPCIVLFQAENLESLTEEGLQHLQKIRSLAKESGSPILFSVCNLREGIQEEWKSFWKEDCKIFHSQEEAIHALEKEILSENPTQPPSLAQPNLQYTGDESLEVSKESTKPNEKEEQGEKEEYKVPTLCPHCSTLLISLEPGLHHCHSCGGSFYLYKNGLSIPYEKLFPKS